VVLTLNIPVRRLLDTFFVGFGLAFAVHFVVLPITCEDLVTIVLNEYLHVLKKVIDAKAELLISVPSRDWNTNKANSEGSDSDAGTPSDRMTPWPEADKWTALTAIATECQIKIQSEMRYVKREVTFSRLNGKDYSSISKLLRNILIPISGLETVIHVNDRVEKQGGWTSARANNKDDSGSEGYDRSLKEIERERWASLFTKIDPAFKLLWKAMIEGLDYAFYTLRITKKPAFSTKAELEARAVESSEGEGFAQYLENTINHFLVEREGPLREWCTQSGMDESQISNRSAHLRHTSHLYLLLDVSLFLLFCASDGTDPVGIARVLRGRNRRRHPGSRAVRRLESRRRHDETKAADSAAVEDVEEVGVGGDSP
jgi:hypothetical protein